MSGRTRRKLRVLYCAAEAAPFVKTGGLGDVAGSLPHELKRCGCKVAVMLPFVGNSGIKERCLEYYRGFLMAVDSLKRQGQSVEVYAFDTPADATLATTLAQVKAAGVDAIVGPFYGAQIEEACRFGRQNGVRVFIPFTSKVSDVYTNPYVYLLNAPDAEKQEAVYDLYNLALSGKTRLVVLRTAAGNEAQFAGYMQQQVKAQGGSATAVSATATDAELRAALAPDAPNVLLPDASDQATLDALLPRLRDALVLSHGDRPVLTERVPVLAVEVVRACCRALVDGALDGENKRKILAHLICEMNDRCIFKRTGVY